MASDTTTYLPHILLLGATGRIGRLFMVEALSRGYTITALARSPASLSTFTSAGLTVVEGTPTSSNDLTSAVRKSLDVAEGRKTIIVSTLGQTRATGSPFSAPTSPPLFISQSFAALFTVVRRLPASSRSQIRKLVVTSMFGVGESFSNLHFAIRPVMRYSNMVQTLDDHNAVDRLLKGQNDIDWVMVRPSMLKEGGRKDVKIRGDNGRGEGYLPSSTTTGTVVDFLLRCVASDEWNSRTPVIVN